LENDIKDVVNTSDGSYLRNKSETYSIISTSKKNDTSFEAMKKNSNNSSVLNINETPLISGPETDYASRKVNSVGEDDNPTLTRKIRALQDQPSPTKKNRSEGGGGFLCCYRERW
jgi:hypothetical protein